MRYLLDTDICIYAMNRRSPKVVAALRKHFDAGLGVSAVTVAELNYGAQRTGSDRNLQALRQFLAPFEVAAFETQAAEVFGQLRAWLASQGTPIGPYDLQIAAQALALGVTLVSNNVREFSRVPGLRLENWAQ